MNIARPQRLYCADCQELRYAYVRIDDEATTARCMVCGALIREERSPDARRELLERIYRQRAESEDEAS